MLYCMSCATVFKYSDSNHYLDVVVAAHRVVLQGEGLEGVVDGVPHGAADGPAAQGVVGVGVGVWWRLDEASTAVGYHNALAPCREQAIQVTQMEKVFM